MKNYKDFNKEQIGFSDIATLIVVGICEDELLTDKLYFGEDGLYRAYIVEGEDVTIPEHYTLKFSLTNWVRIYDDDTLQYHTSADKINIYRAGNFGCIIQLINPK